MTEIPTLAEYFEAVPSLPGGNSPWAARYGRDLRNVIERQAARQPRQLQAHLGPSELGVPCDRQVVSKMAAEPRTGHVIDQWPAILGTAVHAWLAEKFAIENTLDGTPRWLTEIRVAPVPAHPGTSDLYDQATRTVVDWKVQGPTVQARLKAHGPSRQYLVQLLLYAMGWRNAGYQVDRVALVSLPRTAPTLSQMYVWERPHTAEDDILVGQVLAETELRAMIARRVMAREVRIEDVPRTPGEWCAFCPFYRPEAAREAPENRGPGCPGHSPYTYPGHSDPWYGVDGIAVLPSLHAVCTTLDCGVDFQSPDMSMSRTRREVIRHQGKEPDDDAALLRPGQPAAAGTVPPGTAAAASARIRPARAAAGLAAAGTPAGVPAARPVAAAPAATGMAGSPAGRMAAAPAATGMAGSPAGRMAAAPAPAGAASGAGARRPRGLLRRSVYRIRAVPGEVLQGATRPAAHRAGRPRAHRRRRQAVHHPEHQPGAVQALHGRPRHDLPGHPGLHRQRHGRPGRQGHLERAGPGPGRADRRHAARGSPGRPAATRPGSRRGDHHPARRQEPRE